MKVVKKALVAGLAVCLAASGAAAQQATQKKALMLIAQKNFQDDELAVPKAVLEKNGVKVTVASTTLSEARGMNGSAVKPDILLGEASAADYDVIIFVGGSGTPQYFNDPLALRLAQEAVSMNKIVGAICLAPKILMYAGVLKGKRATVYPSEGMALTAAGVNYTGRPVEKDGTIITADGPGSAQEFGEELVRELLGT